MNLVFCLPDSHFEVSGGNLFNQQMIRAFEGLGHQVQLCFESDFDSLSHLCQGADFVIQDTMLFPKLSPLLRAVPASIPVIGMCHVPQCFIGESSASEDEAAYLNNLDGLFFVSEATRAETKQILKVTRIPSHIFAAGRPRSSSHKKEDSSCLNLIQVGRICPHKNQAFSLKLLRYLDHWYPNLDYSFSMVGPIGDRNYFENVMDESQSCRGRVRYLGVLRGKELEKAYLNNEILLIPSRYESLSLVAREAMAYGLWPLSSSQGGVRDVLQQIPKSLLNEGDLEEFSKRLRLFNQDKTFRDQLRFKFKSITEDWPTWEQSAEAAIRWLSSLSVKERYPQQGSRCHSAPLHEADGANLAFDR